MARAPSYFPFASLASREVEHTRAENEILANEGEDRGVEEIPFYEGPTWDEIDWDDVDYDEVYDDVGDEDEDSYGEDTGGK